MSRAIKLMKISVAGVLNRLRFDLARELVVLLSGAVVLATFGYIINDFLNVQISGLSHVMRDRFAEPVAGAVMILASFYAGAVIRRELSGQETVSRAAAFLGEQPSVLRTYHLLFVLLTVTVLHATAWWLTTSYLMRPSWIMRAAWEALMLLTTVASTYWYRERAKVREHAVSRWLESGAIKKSRTYAFARWRLSQMFMRNRTARACFVVALCFYALLIPLQAGGIPFFASVACAILAATVAASSIFFQLSEDLNYAWAERTMGISHSDFCRGYQYLGYTLAALLVPTCVGTYVTGGLVFGRSDVTPGSMLTLALMSITAPVMAPMLMFQIDGRRPMINMVLLAIGAMFVGTAVFASPFSVILIPILGYYAQGSQAGRFYRA